MEHEPSNPTVEDGHEPSGIDAHAIWLSGVALAAFMALGLLITGGLMVLFAQMQPVIIGASDDNQPPTPAGVPELDPDQQLELQQLRIQQQAMLDEYQWIDRPAGIARIPIQRAMQILAADGLQPPANASAPPSANNEGRQP